jgi:lipopolysaccharide/colanic/teichoic acid biosynthesis glycosyltransferase
MAAMTSVEDFGAYSSLPRQGYEAIDELRDGGWPASYRRTLDAALSAVVLVLAVPMILAVMIFTQITARGPALWVKVLAVVDGDPFAGRYAAVKRPLDLTLSAVLLVLAAPVILVTMALVKLTSRGPALYTQVRAGRDGRPFVLYKVRSMVHNYESGTGPRWATCDDPGVTPVGRFLRRSHLDELPQLYNVLRGDMSLVGPRPERPEIIARLETAIPRYRERLVVRPGLTGLAQVHLPPDTTFADVRRKLAYDLFSIQESGFWMDFRILLSTACFLTGVPFLVSRRLLRIPGPAAERELEPGLLTEAEPASQMQPA